MLPHPLSPTQIAASLTDLWSPRIIGEVDDAYIKVARVHGSFLWHAHDDQDELFLVLKGRLRIDMDDHSVDLDEGQMFIVPKTVRHRPIADQECLIMLIERKSTRHTGDVVNERTRSIRDQLGS